MKLTFYKRKLPYSIQRKRSKMFDETIKTNDKNCINVVHWNAEHKLEPRSGEFIETLKSVKINAEYKIQIVHFI